MYVHVCDTYMSTFLVSMAGGRRKDMYVYMDDVLFQRIVRLEIHARPFTSSERTVHHGKELCTLDPRLANRIIGEIRRQ